MIVLTRHGHTDAGRGLCVGRTDVPLSELGREQAENLARAWENLRFARVCSSPSGRARATVMPLARQYDSCFEVMPEFDEINMGRWDGLSFEDIRTRFPEAYAERGERFGDFRAPGGESFNDVADRALPALSFLAKGPCPVFIVTHAGVIRSVLCRLTGHPMDDLFHFKPDYGQCILLDSTPDGLELVEDDMATTVISRYR